MKQPVRAQVAKGRQAETEAATFVAQMGMQVMDRNLRVGPLELDIVARDNDAVVVVEVRCRGQGSWVRAFASINYAKRANLRRAAQMMWLRRWNRIHGIQRVRFDIIAVNLEAARGKRIQYVRAAFGSEGGYAAY